MRALPLFEDPQVQPILDALTNQHRLDAELLIKLCNLELESSGKGRADGIDADIADALDVCLKRMGEQ